MKKKTPPPAKPEKEIRTVWEARLYSMRDGNYQRIGYLVTPSGDPNKPIGIVYDSDGSAEDDERELNDAALAADEPWRLSAPMFYGIDLRGRELPEWLWALRVAPIEDEGGMDDDAEQALNPFCPGRFYKIASEFVDQQFTAEQRAKRPLIAVGIEDGKGDCVMMSLEDRK